MAIEFGKGIALAGGFDLGAKAPLDSRLTVATIEERDAHVTGNRAYEGMLVYVEADKKTYQLIDNTWKEFGFNAESLQAEIVDDLVTDDSSKVLSAKQGKVLKDALDAEILRAQEAEEANAEAIKAIADDYLKEEDKTELQNNINELSEAHTTDKETLENSIKAITDDYLKEEDKTELQDNIDEVNGKVTTLIGEDANKSVRTIANEELAKQLIAEGAAESLDTLTEIAQWIQDHPDDASAMNKAIEDLTALVGTLPEEVTATTVVGLIQELVKAEEDRAKVAEKANADAIKALQEATAEDGTITAAIKAAQDKADANEAAIAILNGADTKDGSVAKAIKEAKDAAATDATNKANAAEEAAKGHADNAIATLLAEDGQVGKNTADIVALKEIVNKLDGAENVEGSLLNLIKGAKAEAATDATTKANQAVTDANAYTDEKVADLVANDEAQEKEIANILTQLGEGKVQDRIDAAVSTAATDATNKANKALADAKSHVTEVLAGLEGSVSVSSNRHVLTGVTEAGGKLTNKAEVELSNIAFSGTTDDLEQGTKTLVFNCGNSTI